MLGLPETDLFKIALTMPKAIEAEADATDNTEEWAFITKAINEAIKKCEEFRLTEGKVLEGKFIAYIDKIESLLAKVAESDPQRIAGVKERIQKHFDEYKIGDNIDKNRFEQELIYYIEKLDISEEKVRLKNQ